MPTPQRVSYGSVTEFPGWRWDAQGLSREVADEAEAVCGPSVAGGFPIVFRTDPSLSHAQAYRLKVGEGKALLEAKEEVGFYYALQSLRCLQGVRSDGRRIVRAADVLDWPAFETRGLITGVGWSKQMGAMKFNMLQYPGGRGTLDGARLQEYVSLIDDCRRSCMQFSFA